VSLEVPAGDLGVFKGRKKCPERVTNCILIGTSASLGLEGWRLGSWEYGGGIKKYTYL
jgi:hypothetical protein